MSTKYLHGITLQNNSYAHQTFAWTSPSNKNPVFLLAKDGSKKRWGVPGGGGGRVLQPLCHT